MSSPDNIGASSLTGGQSALASAGRQETQLTSGVTEQQLAEVTGSCPLQWYHVSNEKWPRSSFVRLVGECFK